MVILEMQFQVEADERVRFLDLLRSLPERIRAENGCLSCSISEEDEEEEGVSLFMNWRSSRAFHAHRMGRNHANLMVAIEQLCNPPRLSMSFGGDVEDFAALLGEQSEPERVRGTGT